MSDTQVLVVGAGPTGLVLALWLHRLGVRVRVVDRAVESGTTSRALAVQTRTLEFYRQLGLAEAVIEDGLKFSAANLWVRGQRAARVAFGDMGEGLSPYPCAVIFPQDAHERLLTERLAREGVVVERPTELLGFEDDGARIVARLRGPDGSEATCEADYLAGCDGVRSRVRDALGVGFPGGTYEHLFYVADVEGAGPVMNGELHVALDDADFVAAFPMKGTGRARLVGVAEMSDGGHAAHAWRDVGKSVLERLGVDIRWVNWFSTYHVHHRVAGRFRRGRAFLLGDAAHIHSPVGGQGMNTGIADAVNLAWKLAAVLQGRAVATLLDTYEPERIAFARRLVATTDRAFTAITSPRPLARFFRVQLAPRLLPALARSAFVRRLMFRTISQTAIRYRASALSEGRAGRICGGDRLPWLRAEDAGSEDWAGNYAPLTSLDWQAHVYGGPAPPSIVQACRARGLASHVFPWTAAARQSGFKRGAVYLMRPDGYVALADPHADSIKVERFLDDRGIRPMSTLMPQATPAHGHPADERTGSGR